MGLELWWKIWWFCGFGRNQQQKTSSKRTSQYRAEPEDYSRYDLEHDLEIGFMDAYNGSERYVSFSFGNGETISTRIKVPAGIETGKNLESKVMAGLFQMEIKEIFI